jgi:MFS family permease
MSITQEPAVKAHRGFTFGLQAIKIYTISILFYSSSHMLLILLPLSAHALGASPPQIGLMMGAYMFTSMFLRPAAGKIVDKFGTSRILGTALILNVLILSLYLIQELWVFALLRMLQGVILSFFSMVLHLIIIDALPDKSRGQGLSLFSLTSMLPYTYGPFLAVYFADRVPMSYIFMALIPIGLTTLIIGMNLGQHKPKEPSTFNDVNGQEEIHYSAWKDWKLLFPSVTMLLASVIIGTVATFLPLYLQDQELPYAGYYFLTETIVLVTLRFFGRKWIPTDGRFPIRIVADLLLLITIAVSLVRIADSIPIILLAAVCNGIALSMLYPTLLTYVSFVVPERSRGRGIGLFISGADLGTSAGTWGLSLVAAAYSYNIMFAVCTFIGFAAVLYVTLLPAERRMRT